MSRSQRIGFGSPAVDGRERRRIGSRLGAGAVSTEPAKGYKSKREHDEQRSRNSDDQHRRLAAIVVIRPCGASVCKVGVERGNAHGDLIQVLVN